MNDKEKDEDKKLEPAKDKSTKKKKSSWLKVLAKSFMWLIIIVVVLNIAIIGAVYYFIQPERTTSLANKFANEYLDADVKIAHIDITLFSTYPTLNLDINGLEINSKVLKDEIKQGVLPADADSLISFNSFHADINLASLILGRISIGDILIDGLKANAVMGKGGKANWEIYQSNSPESNSPLEIPYIEANSIQLTGVKQIKYESYSDSIPLIADIQVDTCSLKHSSDKIYHLAFKGNARINSLEDVFADGLPLTLSADAVWDNDKRTKTELKNVKIESVSVPMNMQLSMQITPEIVIHDLSANLGTVYLNKILPYLTKDYAAMMKDIDTNISLNASLKTNSNYLPGGELPDMDLHIDIPDSYINYDGYNVDHISANTDVKIKGDNINSATVSIKNMVVDGMGMKMNGDAEVTDLITDPNIKVTMSGNANIAKVLRMLPFDTGIKASGLAKMKATGEFKLSYLNPKDINKGTIKGEMQVDRLFYDLPEDTISVYMSTAKIDIANHQTHYNKRGKATIKDMIAINTFVKDADVTLPYADMKLYNFKFGIGADAGILKKTRAIKPVLLTFSSDTMIMNQSDSSRIKMRKMSGRASARKAKDEKDNIPRLHTVIEAERLSYRNGMERYSMRNSKFDFSAKIRPRLRHERRRFLIDSLKTIYPDIPIDSLGEHAIKADRKYRRVNKIKETEDVKLARQAREDQLLDIALENNLNSLITRCRVKGDLTSEKGRIISPLFPLKTRYTGLDMEFSIDSILLRSLALKAGSSQLSLNGRVNHMRNYILNRRGDPLSIMFNLDSDTLDINELIKTMYAGINYSEKKDSISNSLSGITDDEDLQKAISANAADTTQALPAVLIPRRMDVDIKMNTNYSVYADLIINKMKGNLLMHNGALQLKEFDAKTDAGEIGLTALYSAPRKKDIRAGFDLICKRINLKRFISMIPQVDSILPLLESVQGTVDADLAVTTEVDSSMNVILPSLTAICKLEGDSLTLLDRESFKSISRMLLFKNKQRNLIDNMSVQFTIDNNLLEVMPFVFNIDRYSLGIMGHNDLDLNYKYHISVLKSPLLIKFGLDVSGSVADDKMKIRLCRPKFKNGWTAERVNIIDTTRVSLINEINSAFRRGTDAARMSNLSVKSAKQYSLQSSDADTLSHSDSLQLIDAGILEAPKVVAPVTGKNAKKNKDSKKQNKTKKEKSPAKETEKVTVPRKEEK